MSLHPPPPLRFLLCVVGAWACLRAAFLMPGAWERPVQAALPRWQASAVARGAAPRVEVKTQAVAPARREPGLRVKDVAAEPRAEVPTRARTRLPLPALPPLFGEADSATPRLLEGEHSVFPARASLPAATASRWSASAWLVVRRSEAPGLAAPGMLGGSQAGARLSYRVAGDPERPLALSARVSMPISRTAGAEAALGIDWKPLRKVPVHLLAERRQALGSEGRSAFALLAYGGVDGARVKGRLELDAYAQAGVVGARSHDLFADGAASLSLPIGDEGRLRLGAGAWAAAQPGVARLDVGPRAALRLTGPTGPVTVAVDWRMRIAGNAAPSSGPALTLSSGF